MAHGAYTLEEFCLSVAAYRHVNVRQCPDLIHHYWSRKQLFRAKVKAWVAKHAAAPFSAEALADTRKVSAHLPRPPRLQRLDVQADHPGAAQAQAAVHPRNSLRLLRTRNEFDQACGPV